MKRLLLAYVEQVKEESHDTDAVAGYMEKSATAAISEEGAIGELPGKWGWEKEEGSQT